MFDGCLVDVGGIESYWVGGSYVYGDLVAEGVENGYVVFGFKCYEYVDFVEVFGYGIVDVSGDYVFWDFEFCDVM